MGDKQPHVALEFETFDHGYQSKETFQLPPQAQMVGGTVAEHRQSASHPTCTLFFLMWKSLSLFVYCFSWIIPGASSIAIFITVVVLVAFDFWTVKNVSGRLMVGLRWWNEVLDDGSSHWIFESAEDKSMLNATEKTIFWAASFLTPVCWLTLGIVSIFKLTPQWLTLIAVALALSSANLWGYIKCAREDRQSISSMATSFLTNQFVSGVTQQQQTQPPRK